MFKCIFKLIYSLTKIICSIIIGSTILAFILFAEDIHETLLLTFQGDSVVMLMTDQGGGGTGFSVIALSGKKFILTNSHVCGRGTELTAYHGTKTGKKLKILARYNLHDLCLLENYKGIYSVNISKHIIPNERVYVIGHPGLRDLTFEVGRYISDTFIQSAYQCKKDSVKKLNGDIPISIEKLMSYFSFCTKTRLASYINVAVYGGNSGSPVFNKFGQVVGVVFNRRQDQAKASFMVPLHYVKQFLKDY